MTLAAGLDQVAQDVLLGAAVDGDDVEAGSGGCGALDGELAGEAFVPRVGRLGGDRIDQVEPHHAGAGAGHPHQLDIVQDLAAQAAVHRPLDAELAGQGPGVDAFDADDAVLGQLIRQAASGAEVGRPV